MKYSQASQGRVFTICLKVGDFIHDEMKTPWETWLDASFGLPFPRSE